VNKQLDFSMTSAAIWLAPRPCSLENCSAESWCSIRTAMRTRAQVSRRLQSLQMCCYRVLALTAVRLYNAMDLLTVCKHPAQAGSPDPRQRCRAAKP